MRRVVPTLLCVVLLASACSDDDSTSDTVAADVTSATTPAADVTGTTSSSPTDDESAICAALDELEASGDALRDVEVVAQGTNALEAAFSDVKDNLAAVRESAGDGLSEALERCRRCVRWAPGRVCRVPIPRSRKAPRC